MKGNADNQIITDEDSGISPSKKRQSIEGAVDDDRRNKREKRLDENDAEETTVLEEISGLIDQQKQEDLQALSEKQKAKETVKETEQKKDAFKSSRKLSNIAPTITHRKRLDNKHTRRKTKAGILSRTSEEISYYNDSQYDVSSVGNAPANILDKLAFYAFPRHGLLYDVVDGKDTQHKKDIEDFKNRFVIKNGKNQPFGSARGDNLKVTFNSEESAKELDNFEESLKLKLNGIENIIKNLKKPAPQVYFSKKRGLTLDDKESNLDFITKLVNSKNPSKDVANLIYKIEATKDPKQLLYQVANSDIAVQKLLSGFFEKNKDNIDVENPDNNHIPFVFLKHAIKSELLLIGRQLLTLEGVNSDLSKRGTVVKNVSFLTFRDDNESKKNMISYISSKRAQGSDKGYRTYAIEDVFYRDSIVHPVIGAKFQYGKLLKDGVLDTASSDPATRANSLCQEGEILSEKQCDAYILGSEAMEEGGYCEIIMGLGTGKTRLKQMMLRENSKETIDTFDALLNSKNVSDFMALSEDEVRNFIKSKQGSIDPRSPHSPKPHSPVPQIRKRQSIEKDHKVKKERCYFDIDLNSTAEDIARIRNIKKLQSTILSSGILEMDDAMINEVFPGFDIERLRKVSDSQVVVLADEFHFAGSGQFSYRENYTENLPALESEKLKYDVISDLTANKGSFLAYGASGSINKITKECNIIEKEIEQEEQSLSNPQNKILIRAANRFLYQVNGHKLAQGEPAFKSVISDKIANREWNNDAKTINSVGIGDKKDKNKAHQEPVSVFGKKLTNKQYLVRTAFFLYKLASNFALDSVEDLEEFQNLKNALTPKSLGGNKEYDKNNELHNQLRSYKTNPQKGISNVEESLKDLLLLSASGINSRKNKYKIDPEKLLEAVKDFYNAGLHKILPLENSSSQSALISTSESRKPKINKLRDKHQIKLSQLEDVKERLDSSIEEFVNKTNISLHDSDEAPNNLFEVVKPHLERIKGVESSLLSSGEKGLYVLHDFKINEDTAKEDHIKNIMELSGVDILILPHEDKDGIMKCKIVHKAFGNIESLESPLNGIDDQIDAIAKAINKTPSILSFFDSTNSIGGDYQSASYGNIVLRVGQVTDKDFLAREDKAFSFQDVMQGDRNRTNKNNIDYDKMKLEFIIPKNYTGFDLSEGVGQGLLNALLLSTSKDEDNRLKAYEYYLDSYTEYNKKPKFDLEKLKEDSAAQQEYPDDKMKRGEENVEKKVQPKIAKSQLSDVSSLRSSTLPRKEGDKSGKKGMSPKMTLEQKKENRRRMQEEEQKQRDNIIVGFDDAPQQLDENDEMEAIMKGMASSLFSVVEDKQTRPRRRDIPVFKPLKGGKKFDSHGSSQSRSVASELKFAESSYDEVLHTPERSTVNISRDSIEKSDMRVDVDMLRKPFSDNQVLENRLRATTPELQSEESSYDEVLYTPERSTVNISRDGIKTSSSKLDDADLDSPSKSPLYKTLQDNPDLETLNVSSVYITPIENSKSEKITPNSEVTVGYRPKRRSSAGSVLSYRSDLSVRSNHSVTVKFMDAIKEIDREKSTSSPSLSIKPFGKERMQDVEVNPFRVYEIESMEDSYVATLEDPEFFLVYKDVYKSVNDIAEIMIAIILDCAEANGLNSEELVKAIEVTRKCGDINNPLLPGYKMELSGKEKEKFSSFVSEVEIMFGDVGIYSIHVSEGNERHGLALSNLPMQIDGLINDMVKDKEISKAIQDEFSYDIGGFIDSKIEEIASILRKEEAEMYQIESDNSRYL